MLDDPTTQPAAALSDRVTMLVSTLERHRGELSEDCGAADPAWQAARSTLGHVSSVLEIGQLSQLEHRQLAKAYFALDRWVKTLGSKREPAVDNRRARGNTARMTARRPPVRSPGVLAGGWRAVRSRLPRRSRVIVAALLLAALSLRVAWPRLVAPPRLRLQSSADGRRVAVTDQQACTSEREIDRGTACLETLSLSLATSGALVAEAGVFAGDAPVRTADNPDGLALFPL